MHSILFSALAGFVNVALFYWLSPKVAIFALLVEIVALFFLSTKAKQWFGAVMAYGLASVWAWAHFVAAMQHQIPIDWQNKAVRLNARIVSMVAEDSLKQHFRVEASEICLEKTCLRQRAKIDLNVYLSPDHPAIRFQPGESWIFYVRLKRLHRLANPGILKPIEWSQDVYAVGTVLARPAAHRLSYTSRFNINALRQALAAKLSNAHLNSNSLAIVLALILGDRSHLSTDLWSLFQRTGVLHLMAISGLHVGLLATFVYGLVYLLLWPFPRCFQFIPRQKIALWVAVCVAWSYGALAGFAVSTVRACVMMSLYALAKSVSRSISWLSVLLWSSVIILSVSPLQSLNMSFWLSFIAVSWIAFLSWVWPQKKNFFHNHITMPLVLSLCLLPISLLFFSRSPLNAAFSNLVAIPWVSFIVLPAALITLFIPDFSGIVQWNVDYFLAFLLKMVEFFPYQWWYSGSLLGLALMVGGVVFLLLPRAWYLRSIAVLWFILALINPRNFPSNTALKVTILDVGQGLSVVLETRHHVVLYDTGPSYYGGGDAASSSLIPFLKRQGVKQIDALVLSHQDNDHSGGVPSVFQALSIATLISSPSQSLFIKTLYDKPPHFLALNACEAGQAWRWDGVDFRFLSPSPSAVDKKGNNMSCVLSVKIGEHGLLLPGDIEERVEQSLLVSQRPYLASEVLIAPHHGSKTSSSLAFIRAIQPKIVIFSTGYLNRYHFPAKNVQKQYQTEGILTYNTAIDGAIQFSFDPRGQMSPIKTVRVELSTAPKE